MPAGPSHTPDTMATMTEMFSDRKNEETTVTVMIYWDFCNMVPDETDKDDKNKEYNIDNEDDRLLLMMTMLVICSP